MKKVMFGILGLVLLFAGLASAAIPANCDPSMIAYWKMDDAGTSSLTLDSYGNNNGGEFPNSDILKVNRAAYFIGSEKVIVKDASALDFIPSGETNPTSFTIQFWFKKGSAEYENAYFIKKGNYELKYTFVDDYSGSYVESMVGGVSVKSDKLDLDSKDYFVTLVWDKNAQMLKLYINGTLKDSKALSTLGETSTDLVFGEGFEGLIDEVAFFNKALTQTEITNYYVNSSAQKDYCYKDSGDDSFTQVELDLGGCEYNGDYYGIGSCTSDGLFFCVADDDLLSTITSANACAYQDPTWTSINPLPECCPIQHDCKDDPDISGTEKFCVQREDGCEKYDNMDDCEKQNCFWNGTESNGNCINKPSSCSDYYTSERCLNDAETWKVGIDGCNLYDGAQLVRCMNTNFSIGCACSWSDERGCTLATSYNQSIFWGAGPSSYVCDRNYTSGDCIDGDQLVEWTARFVNRTTTPESVVDNADILEACNCKSGSKTRFCGEELVKLPGFSLFAFVTSVAIIGLFYLFRKDL